MAKYLIVHYFKDGRFVYQEGFKFEGDKAPSESEIKKEGLTHEVKGTRELF